MQRGIEYLRALSRILVDPVSGHAIEAIPLSAIEIEASNVVPNTYPDQIIGGVPRYGAHAEHPAPPLDVERSREAIKRFCDLPTTLTADNLATFVDLFVTEYERLARDD